jgi:hypothetical protein
MNFGFNMKYNKSGKNLQGKINVIFRRLVNGEWRTYQIKSNAINSLAVTATTAGRRASIATKANLSEITDPLNPISLGGNLDLSLIAFESTATTGAQDQIAIQVTSGTTSTTLIFASNWVSSSNAMQTLGGGKIQVRNGTEASPTANREAPTSVHSAPEQLDVQIYPNPNNGAFYVELPEAYDNIAVRVLDLQGRVIATQHMQDGTTRAQISLQNATPGMYMVEVKNEEKYFRTRIVVQ